ncbi:hypothetical protein [Natrialba sp. PRR66]|uniref:hypothetical protein n=1 Tax=Natrialba sp. PRR66 TaxID=3098146 RepID=UPI002B1DA8F4|nr:hypothetical protein [Natrialba sp. PRR66]
MNNRRIAFALTLAYLWVVMIHLGALVFETFIIYPNIFHDVPHSLETSMTFMAVRGPADFFPPIGFLSLLLGLSSVVLGWRVRSARYWILASVLLAICGEFVLSVAYFWPRNEILFVEGMDVHSAAYLQQTAREFQIGHWLRFASNLVVAAFAFVGFLRFYRHRVIGQNPHPERKEAEGRN